jgi:lipoprotein-anchoring transpeptidase ErfK/SrfK
VRTRSFLLVSLVLLVLLGLAAGVYAYDESHERTIAQGIRVGGVALGGLTADEARARLEREILEPLRQPLVVQRDDRTWPLGAREARIAADLDSSVDEALARSRGGNLFTRTLRDVTGKHVRADSEPTVAYSDAALVRLIDKVRKAVERKPRDATVQITATGVSSEPARRGLAVRASELHEQMRRAIVSPHAPRRFTVRTRKLQPKVGTEDLERKYGTVLIVQRKSFRLQLYKGLELAKTYPIAVGKVGMDTPAGLYNIQNKAIDPAWHVPDSDWAGELAGKVIPGGTPENPIKARWLGVYDGVGVHGTADDSSIGSAASHGCIRMHIPDVEELYDRVPVGAPIYIA